MVVFIVGAVLLLLGTALFYWIGQSHKKDRQIQALAREVEKFKTRQQTAKGGLSREDKLKVLDLIAKVDLLEGDSELVTLRAQDLKRSLVKLMNKEKKEMNP